MVYTFLRKWQRTDWYDNHNDDIIEAHLILECAYSITEVR